MLYGGGPASAPTPVLLPPGRLGRLGHLGRARLEVRAREVAVDETDGTAEVAPEAFALQVRGPARPIQVVAILDHEEAGRLAAAPVVGGRDGGHERR